MDSGNHAYSREDHGADAPGRFPSVSVVMPARNAGPYLDEAVASILDQSFRDFELVIRDDGSTDETLARLRRWAERDRRIRLFHGDALGVVGSSNWIVEQARAPFIARMDADDVAAPHRLERQLALLQADPAVTLVGSLCHIIDASGRRVRNPDFWRLARRSRFMPFPHSSIMFRRSAFDRAGGYRRNAHYWEDLDLCLRLQAIGKVAVIADALVSHRVSPSSVRLSRENEAQIEAAVDDMYNAVEPRAHDEAPRRRGLRPLAFVSINSGLLWGGARPRVLGRMIARSRLGLDVESLLSLSWATLALISPRLLRFLLRFTHLARNLRVRRQIRPGEVYDWRPESADQPGRIRPAAERAPALLDR